MRSRNQNRLDDLPALGDLVKDLISDLVYYCACVIVTFSDDFYDDLHNNEKHFESFTKEI